MSLEEISSTTDLQKRPLFHKLFAEYSQIRVDKNEDILIRFPLYLCTRPEVTDQKVSDGAADGPQNRRGFD